ncbi:MAG TPA: menaquinone biosynthesis protein [Bryobacteraceae bacterium]|nr:menaquinone biosynthesis protein [Bryobacteraceae bacterium]
MKPDHNKLRVRAVSYLNTVPLVWGMLHGAERDEVDLSFSIPSECARDVERGGAEVGLVPVAEIARQGLEIAPGVGIACYGAVRSILLCSRVPWSQVKTLAADASSRTSVELARVILRERYGVEPAISSEPPDLAQMLAHADSALLIGDPALRTDPLRTGYQCLDLGAEWLALTGLPFVFAAWAAKPGVDLDRVARVTTASYAFGRDHIDEIVEAERERRGVSRELARRYLTEHIRFEIGPEEQRGLETFFELANLRTPALTART